MFDIGFLEIAVIMVLGLLVLGPERLPKAAQKIGYWVGKTRRYVEGMKTQIESELDATEVKRLLHNQEVQIRELQDKLTDTADHMSSDMREQIDDMDNSFDDMGDDDPGASHEDALQASAEAKPTEPQYDIIEDDAMNIDAAEIERLSKMSKAAVSEKG